MSQKRYLPETIALFHSEKDLAFNLERPSSIFDGDDLCPVRNCPHGRIGDYQTSSIESILNPSFNDDKEWTSFIGVDSTIVCHRLYRI